MKLPIMFRKIRMIYEDDLFPCIITEIYEDGVPVQAMTTYGKFWPEKQHILKFIFEEIITGMKTPELLNKRGFYALPELKLNTNTKFNTQSIFIK